MIKGEKEEEMPHTAELSAFVLKYLLFCVVFLYIKILIDEIQCRSPYTNLYFSSKNC